MSHDHFILRSSSPPGAVQQVGGSVPATRGCNICELGEAKSAPAALIAHITPRDEDSNPTTVRIGIFVMLRTTGGTVAPASYRDGGPTLLAGSYDAFSVQLCGTLCPSV
jgi:hypothetical protein